MPDDDCAGSRCGEAASSCGIAACRRLPQLPLTSSAPLATGLRELGSIPFGRHVVHHGVGRAGASGSAPARPGEALRRVGSTGPTKPVVELLSTTSPRRCFFAVHSHFVLLERFFSDVYTGRRFASGAVSSTIRRNSSRSPHSHDGLLVGLGDGDRVTVPLGALVHQAAQWVSDCSSGDSSCATHAGNLNPGQLRRQR